MTIAPGPSPSAPPGGNPPSRPVTPPPSGPVIPPRQPKNHYAVNGRPYLAELDVLTTRALELADDYEAKLTALFDRPVGKVGVR